MSLKPLDPVQWYNALTRREFTFGIAVSGIGLDEPDTVLVENFTYASVRNYIN